MNTKKIVQAFLLTALGMAVIHSRAISQEDGGKSETGKSSHKKDGKKPAPYTGPKYRIAIADISDQQLGSLSDGQVAPPATFGTGLTEILTTSLIKSGHFNVLERAKFDAIKSELVLDNSGLVTPSSAAKIGKLQGAEYLITGAITEYSNKAGGGGVQVGGFSFGSKGGTATLGIDLRIINVTTGEVTFAVTAQGKSGSSGNAISYVDSKIAIGGKNYNNSALGKAVRNAMNNAVQQLCDQFEQIQGPAWHGEVVDVDLVGGKPDTIYLDGGSQAGLKEGDELEIVVLGKEIKNHEGEVIDHKPDKHIARCKVTTVKEKSATASLTEAGDFNKDDISTYLVRRISPPKTDDGDGGDKADKKSTDGGSGN